MVYRALHTFRIVDNAEVIREHFRSFPRGPETGFEEINGDVLDADFRPGIISG